MLKYSSIAMKKNYLKVVETKVYAGFYRTQYPASYTHKSLGRTRQFTLPASAGTQMCLLCLSLKSQIPKFSQAIYK